jgi:Tfp pilus assembly protein PilO
MNLWLTSVENRLRRLGWPGMVGIALAVFAVMFFFSAIMPARARLELLRNEVAASRDTMSKMARQRMAGGAGQEANLAVFYRFFPEPPALPDLLDRIFAAASHQSLVLEQAEYKLERNREDRIAAYHINLPVQGSYLQIRNFIVEVLNNVPTAALENISFQRQAIGTSVVDGKVRFTLYLRAQ